MNKVTGLLIGAYAVSVIFSAVEWDYTNRYDFFPLFDGYAGWDGKMPLATYVYHYCQYAVIMMIVYAAWLASGYKIFQVVFWLEFLDIIDYALRYNHTWFTVYGFDVEYNHFKLITLLYFVEKYGDSK